MKLLPTEQKQKSDAAEAQLRALQEGGRMALYEPCNCNGQVRHNNGGNYHEEIYIALDDGNYYVKYASTSEYDQSEWEDTTLDKLVEVVRHRAANGYYLGE